MAPAQATVWGFVGQGAAVTVTFDGQSIRAQPSTWLNQSTWLAKLPATRGLITAQGPQEFNITATSGGVTITLADVVFGDVWVCSGQSNMAYGTFRLNFHRFDRFEPDLRGHTQP